MNKAGRENQYEIQTPHESADPTKGRLRMNSLNFGWSSFKVRHKIVAPLTVRVKIKKLVNMVLISFDY